jgi:RHS repeat-associated protein
MLVIRDSQLAALRRPAVAEGLVRRLTAAGLAAAFDEAAGDVLVVDPTGAVMRVGFDAAGYATEVTSFEGRTWRVEVDADGRAARVTDPDGGWLGLRYAAAGRLAAVSRGRVDVRRYDWTAAGRLAQVAYPDGTVTRFAAGQADGVLIVGDRRGGVRTVIRDARGRVASIQDPNGNRTRFEYDDAGRRTAAFRPDGSWQEYAYDDAGRLRRVSDEAGLVVGYDYDGGGLLAAVRYADGTTVRVDRDAAGRPTAARVWREPAPDGADGAVPGPAGAAAAVRVGAAPAAVVPTEGPALPGGPRATWAYDVWCRPVADDGGLGAAGGLGTVRYGYDAAGGLASIAWPDDWGAGGRAQFHYDRDGRPTAVVDWAGGEHHFTYAPDDAGLMLWHSNGLVTTVSTGDGGRPRLAETRRRNAPADAPPLFAVGYQFDAEGRLRVLRDSEFDARSYGYDAEGQLASVQWAAGHAETFDYDPAGNRAKVSGLPVRADGCDRLTAHGPVQLSYDARGNLAALVGPGVDWKYRYDARGLLVRATNRADGVRLAFEYDAVGRRTLKRAHGTVTRFVWAGDHMVREVVETAAGTRSVRDYLYVPGTHVPLALRIDGAVYCYHCDHLGVPRRLTDPAGAVVWSADYGAFGRGRPAVAVVDQPLRLPGQYHDAETRLHYARYRYYAPDLGRYISPRPPGPDAVPHDYRYADNDPVNGSDPLGLGTTSTLQAPGWPSPAAWRAGSQAGWTGPGGVAGPAGPGGGNGHWADPAAGGGAGAWGSATTWGAAVVGGVPLPTPAPAAGTAVSAAAVAAALAFRLNEAFDDEQFRPPGTPADAVRSGNAEALAALPPLLWPTAASGWRELSQIDSW